MKQYVKEVLAEYTKSNILAMAIVTLVVVIFVRQFIFEGFFVSGDSMAPTILAGDFVLVNKLAYLWDEPERADIVVAIPRVYPGKVVKRIIGLPHEWFMIENSRVVIKNSRSEKSVNLDEGYLEFPDTPEVGKTRTNIDPNEYFALGDNRKVSIDSRELGMIGGENIKGRVFGVVSFKRATYIGF
ncbi:MAG TPA: signal peptidase I [Candidatus Paceibacterota bacterium]